MPCRMNQKKKHDYDKFGTNFIGRITNTVPTDIIVHYKISNLDIDQYNILV
jgi:hypothetical protein